MVIGPLVNTKHGISTGDILISDTQTILVPNFNYDGTGKGKIHSFSFIFFYLAGIVKFIIYFMRVVHRDNEV